MTTTSVVHGPPRSPKQQWQSNNRRRRNIAAIFASEPREERGVSRSDRNVSPLPTFALHDGCGIDRKRTLRSSFAEKRLTAELLLEVDARCVEESNTAKPIADGTGALFSLKAEGLTNMLQRDGEPTYNGWPRKPWSDITVPKEGQQTTMGEKNMSCKQALHMDDNSTVSFFRRRLVRRRYLYPHQTCRAS